MPNKSKTEAQSEAPRTEAQQPVVPSVPVPQQPENAQPQPQVVPQPQAAKQETPAEKELKLERTRIAMSDGEERIKEHDHFFASTEYKEMVDAYKAILDIPKEDRFLLKHKEKYQLLEQKANFYVTEKGLQGIDVNDMRDGEYTPEALRLGFANSLATIGENGAASCDYVDQRLDDTLMGIGLMNHCSGGPLNAITSGDAFGPVNTESYKIESVANFSTLMARAANTVDTYPAENMATKRVLDDVLSPEVTRYLLAVLKHAPDSWFPNNVKEQLDGMELTDLSQLKSDTDFRNLRNPKLTEGDLKKLSLITIKADNPGNKLLTERINRQEETDREPTEITPFKTYVRIAVPELKRRAELALAEERRLANANTTPIFTPAQVANYNKLFRENAGSSSPEYEAMETAFRAAVAFNAEDELRTPGTGDELRQALHKAAADYYNAKLPQEQDETRRSRMDLARSLFRATAPEVRRGESGIAPAEADGDQPAEQPEYTPLSLRQVTEETAMTNAAAFADKVSVQDRDNAYGAALDELKQKALSLYMASNGHPAAVRNGLSEIHNQLAAARGALDTGKYDDVNNRVNRIIAAADGLLGQGEKTNEETAFAETMKHLGTPEKMAAELGARPDVLADRDLRREAVERYRDKLKAMQQRMKSTERLLFNRDSEEYKTMAAEVGRMLDFLNNTMLGQNDPDSVINIDSRAFKFRLRKLQDAAAGYYNAKILQDKNANRQTRFDLAAELMELPDLRQYGQDLAVAKNSSELPTVEVGFLTTNALNAADLTTVESAAKLLSDPNIHKTFEEPYFENREIHGPVEDNIFAVRGGKMIYDLLKKEQEGRKILEKPADYSPARQAQARRDVLLGAGIRSYVTKNYGPSAEPDDIDGPTKTYLISLGKNPAQLDELKKSLLQKAADVAALEKEIQAELPNFHASDLALVDAPKQQPAVKQPEVKEQPDQQDKQIEEQNQPVILPVEEQKQPENNDYKPIDQMIETGDEQPEVKEEPKIKEEPKVEEAGVKNEPKVGTKNAQPQNNVAPVQTVQAQGQAQNQAQGQEDPIFENFAAFAKNCFGIGQAESDALAVGKQDEMGYLQIDIGQVANQAKRYAEKLKTGDAYSAEQREKDETALAKQLNDCVKQARENLTTAKGMATDEKVPENTRKENEQVIEPYSYCLKGLTAFRGDLAPVLLIGEQALKDEKPYEPSERELAEAALAEKDDEEYIFRRPMEPQTTTEKRQKAEVKNEEPKNEPKVEVKEEQPEGEVKLPEIKVKNEKYVRFNLIDDEPEVKQPEGKEEPQEVPQQPQVNAQPGAEEQQNNEELQPQEVPQQPENEPQQEVPRPQEGVVGENAGAQAGNQENGKRTLSKEEKHSEELQSVFGYLTQMTQDDADQPPEAWAQTLAERLAAVASNISPENTDAIDELHGAILESCKKVGDDVFRKAFAAQLNKPEYQGAARQNCLLAYRNQMAYLIEQQRENPRGMDRADLYSMYDLYGSMLDMPFVPASAPEAKKYFQQMGALHEMIKTFSDLNPNLQNDQQVQEKKAETERKLSRYPEIGREIAEIKKSLTGNDLAELAGDHEADENTKPIFSTGQISRYDLLFRENAGSSSREYQQLEEAYRLAAAFDTGIEQIVPGMGDQVRHALHKAAAAYYNAKLSQEQNETRSKRTALAEELFRATAPNVNRGLSAEPARQGNGLPREQPYYLHLTTPQTLQQMGMVFSPDMHLTEKGRKNAYLTLLDELRGDGRRAYQAAGSVLLGSGNQIFKVVDTYMPELKEKIENGADAGIIKKIMSDIESVAVALNGHPSLTEIEKKFIDRLVDLKPLEEMTDDELHGYAPEEHMQEPLQKERTERRATVESYLNMMQGIQQRMKKTDSILFNRDSGEYKTMATEVSNMLDFLDDMMPVQNIPGRTVDLDSPAFQDRLQKLQDAAADYFNAKILQDKNANRQIRFDLAVELMELPDLNKHRQTLAERRNEVPEFTLSLQSLTELDAVDLRNENGVRDFLTKATEFKSFCDEYSGKDVKFGGSGANIGDGARMVYDLLKKERDGLELLKNPDVHSPVKQALARRDILVGAGIRAYMEKNWKEPASPDAVGTNIPLFDVQSIKKLKNSLLQKASGVTALEQKLQTEGEDFHASARALVVAPLRPVKQPEIKEPEKVEQQPADKEPDEEFNIFEDENKIEQPNQQLPVNKPVDEDRYKDYHPIEPNRDSIGDEDGLEDEKDGPENKKDDLEDEKDGLEDEKDGPENKKDDLEDEKDGLEDKRDDLEGKKENPEDKKVGLAGKKVYLEDEKDDLKTKEDDLKAKEDDFEDDYSDDSDDEDYEEDMESEQLRNALKSLSNILPEKEQFTDPEAAKRASRADFAGQKLANLFQGSQLDPDKVVKFITTTRKILREPGTEKACYMMATCSLATAEDFMTLYGEGGEEALRDAYQTTGTLKVDKNVNKVREEDKQLVAKAYIDHLKNNKAKQNGGPSNGK